MNLPVIHGLWIGDRLSTMEQLCICSFLANGHEFHLHAYTELDGIPDGTTVVDAEKTLSPDRIFRYRDSGSYAGFANLFRYKLLLEQGGCWVDMDVVCLRPFYFDRKYFVAGERIQGKKGHYKANNCVLSAPQGSPLLEYCYSDANSRDPGLLKWGETGPNLVTRAVNELDLKESVCTPNDFCPVDWWDFWKIFRVKCDLEWFRESYGVHMWNEMWRQNSVSKDDSFAAGTLYEQLREKYLK